MFCDKNDTVRIYNVWVVHFMPFYLNTQKQYKIWFSTNPDVFLGMGNQLCFIRARENNKEAILTFIYSAKCLSQEALGQLKTFCEKYSIQPIDFDTDIARLLNGQNDQDIYALAQQELDRTLNNTGGNIAAPSDLVRLLPGVAKSYGIYTDFDVELRFKGVSQIIINSPILIHCSTFQPIPSISNEIFAVAHDDKEMTHLSNDALKMICAAQVGAIDHYKNPKDAILNSWHPRIQSPLKQLCEMSYWIAKNYFEKAPTATVFDFRLYSMRLNIKEFRKLSFIPCYPNPNLSETAKAQITDKACKNYFAQYYAAEAPEWCSFFKAPDHATLADNLIELIKHRLLLCSVTNVSGPMATMIAFKDYFPEVFYFPSSQYPSFIQKIKDSSVTGNNLSQHVWKKTGNPPKHPLEQIGALTDLSWTALGAQKQLKRDKDFAEKALVIQRAFRNHLETNKHLDKNDNGVKGDDLSSNQSLYLKK